MVSSRATASAAKATANLTDIRVDEVSLVTTPAIRKKFFLTKEVKMKIEQLVKDLQEAPTPEAAEEFLKQLDDDTRLAVETAVKALEVVKDKLPAGVLQSLAALLGPADEEPATDNVPKEATKEIEPVTKEMTDLQKQNDELRKAVAKVQGDLRRRDMLEKAAAFAVPNSSQQEIASVLELADDLGERGKVIADVLSKASAAFASSDLLKTAGKTVAKSEGTRLEVEAKKIMKSDSHLTFEQAAVRAMEINPELYNEED